MSEQVPNNEEIDLGQLFKVIGKGISNFFQGIKNLFIGLLNIFIQIALFIKQHFIKIALITFLGAAFGLYKDLYTPKNFESTMLVESHFESAAQLYNIVADINKKDYKGLLQIVIQPVKTDLLQLAIYDKFIIDLDTTTIKNVAYDKFISSLKETDYPLHNITVKTTDSKLFDKIEQAIVEKLNTNKRLTQKQKTSINNIKFTKEKLHQDLSTLDSLEKVYQKALLAESQNNSVGTSIVTAKQNNAQNKELEVFKEKQEIIDAISNLNNAQDDKNKILRIIAHFSKKNKEVGVIDFKTIKYGLAAFFLAVFSILFFNFNRYLNTLKK